MEEKEDLVQFRDSVLPEVDVIASKRWVPVEEHIRVTMVTVEGLTTEGKGPSKKEYLH